MSAEGSPTYETMAAYDRLRYRLMPYIYTVAADTALHDGTMMRGLVMDFASDRRSWGVDDQYMFGPALMAAPVTRFRARSRELYLPAGTFWYDFRTGRAERGGRTIRAEAPYEWMPLYVRAGAIVPTGPAIQTPRRLRVSMCSWVDGFSHMAECMAGATTTGPVKASAVVFRKSSARPSASRARTWVVAGATHSTSAQEAAVMCASSPVPVAERYSSW
jgi:hypothetical protein